MLKGEKKKDSYDRYSEKIEEKTNRINLKEAISTKRKKLGKARDNIVFGKYVWSEAQSYLGPIQSIVIFTALMTGSIIAINHALVMLGKFLGISNPFQFPVELTAFFGFFLIIGIFCFGFISVRYIGTSKRSSELGNKMNSGIFLLDEEICEVRDEQKEMKKMIKEQNALIKKLFALIEGTPLKKKEE